MGFTAISKAKLAFYWCASCGGCEESIIDLAEELLKLEAAAEVVFWPMAQDTKYEDLCSLKDHDITACLINGAVRMDEHEHMARLLRQKSKMIIAHGACAQLGGVYGLANLFDRAEILKKSYIQVPSVGNSPAVLPRTETVVSGGTLSLPRFYKRVLPLDAVVEVDCYIPGCPPTPSLVLDAIRGSIQGTLPEAKCVLGETEALCATCPRRATLPEDLGAKRFKRLFEAAWDATGCFLGQRLICLGPVTRGGCEARCIKANMPCRGCFGPTENVRDQGAKAVAFLASMLATEDEQTLRDIVESIPDPAGLFYRYSLPSSILKGTWKGEP